MKKKLLAIALAAFMAISATACSDGGAETETTAETTTEATTAAEPEDLLPEGAGFKVDGAKLLDANGNEFVIRGINHPHAWFKSELETAYDAIAETGSNSIRIVLGSGVQYGKTNMKELERVINNAKERDMIAVVEVHCITGSDSIDDLLKVTDFWIEMKDVLAGTEAYCILNIANEWDGSVLSPDWGEVLINGATGIKATSEICSIFEDAA